MPLEFCKRLKGQEDDWFGSSFILSLAVIFVVCLCLLGVWEWRQKEPLVDVRLFANFNFSGVNIMMFLAGTVSFSAAVLMPQFLQMVVGYSAQQAGLVVSVGAAILFLTMPIVAMLTAKFPVKYVIAMGWLFSAAGLFFSAKLLTLGVSLGVACGIMLLQFAPVGFIFVPSVTASYFGVPRDKSDAVSGLTNFMRNIGSSFDAAGVQTILARRQQFHLARLADHLSLGDPGMIFNFQAMAMRARSAGLGAIGTQGAVIAQIYREFMMQASAMSFIDVYVVLGTGSAAMFFLSFLLKHNDPKHVEQHAMH